MVRSDTNDSEVDLASGATLGLRAADLVADVPPPENKAFYPALDGLRGIAVLLVFYQHYLNGVIPLEFGWTGVDVFFVLSGFLITGILYDTRDDPHRFRVFYARRTLRIFPLYYGVLFGCLALEPALRWVWHPAWILWPLYFGNYARFIWLHDWREGSGALEQLRSTLDPHAPLLLYLGHFWSLCIEEQFYLVWPLVVFAVQDRARLRSLCLAACVLAPIARIACVLLLPRAYIAAEFLYRVTPLRVDALLIGGALALMLRGPEAARLKRAAPAALTLFGVAFTSIEGGFAVATGHLYTPLANSPLVGTVGYTLIDLFAGLVVLLSLDPANTFYRIFTVAPLRRLGQISYGFYVFHDIPHRLYSLFVLNTVGPMDPPAFKAVVAAVAFGGTLLLSFLSFRYFEAPFLRLKRFYLPGIEAQSQTARLG